MSTFEGPLGMIPPADSVHRVKYPMTMEMTPDDPRPLVIGIPWFTAFDRPVARKNGAHTEYIIGIDPDNLGSLRGGHSVPIPMYEHGDQKGWWSFYNQGREGACTGFAVCRALSWLNRERYDAFELYRQAQRQDDWPGEDYSGTSVRAALDVARTRGPVQVVGTRKTGPNVEDGHLVNRWITDMAGVWAAIKYPSMERRGLVPIKNSWGTRAPWTVLMPQETFDIVAFRSGDGDVAVLTDR
ncbi:MAG TPA: hypothetical protein VNJ04_19685 [Gemmatimonadaceae bacterium]|nr:hypothetical protein [Gemmatimonadaceae bacterium]